MKDNLKLAKEAADKSDDMADVAMSFRDMARQLKERERNRSWFDF
jgi:hypothetical protein